MILQEVVLCATAPQAQGSGSGAIVLHDIQTGTSLASFKQSSSAPHCTSFVETLDGQGGFILAAQQDKSILNVYNFQKDQLAFKIVLPERLSCIALDNAGSFCAGGTAQGRIYLWEVASGILYNSWDAHYRHVNVLKFTHDGAALISGSDDSGVSIWSVARLVDNDTQNELPTPYCTLSDHTLPVKDIACGLGAFPTCRVLTASLDHSVKIWDLSSQSLLTTFHFPKPISLAVWDITECSFFAASPDGSIYQVNLFRQRTEKHAGQTIEAIGGAGVSDVIRVADEDSNSRKRLISVDQPITALTISLTSSLLLVGTATGLIHIYDIASHQLLRTISTHKGMSISHLTTMLKPPDLVGHISLSLNLGSSADAKDIIPIRPIVPFHRTKDSKAREAHEVAMMLPVQAETPGGIPSAYDYPEAEFQQDYAFFVRPNTIGTSEASSARVTELEAEVENLREQLGKAKGINDVMWETVVQRIITQEKQKAVMEGQNATMLGEGEDENDAERPRKKGKKTESKK
ncbi:WD40-repeat-containing domain protein [Suillus bovinus]|uniref:WD40-repeat-containing domain protein n=1 Tax=Suillus bovinus TaxID=48563 RepID=UPI001B863B1C|nr:WD40-repeat-containing domain protein [Suillus bovinus]KAG2129202.1 WD40-repeat-containing domain protein [Suillus bovinus]